MTGMTHKGVHRRAVEARAAVNRLRWEVDLALGVWSNYEPKPWEPREAVESLNEIAEAVAILHRIMLTINERAPEELRTSILTGADLEQRFASMLAHHIRMHEVPR